MLCNLRVMRTHKSAEGFNCVLLSHFENKRWSSAKLPNHVVVFRKYTFVDF